MTPVLLVLAGAITLGDVYGAISIDAGYAQSTSTEADASVESVVVGASAEVGIEVRERFHGTLIAWGLPFVSPSVRDDPDAEVDTSLFGAGLGVLFGLDDGWFVGGALCALLQPQSGFTLGTDSGDIGGAVVLRGGRLWSVSGPLHLGVEARAIYGQVDAFATRWNPASATVSLLVAID
ncbi:MAG: hypothetical protein AAF654_13850 [Myxococcota bacterium]